MARKAPIENQLKICSICGGKDHKPVEFGLWGCVSCGKIRE